MNTSRMYSADIERYFEGIRTYNFDEAAKKYSTGQTPNGKRIFIYRQFKFLLEYLNQLSPEDQSTVEDVDVEKSFEVSVSIMNAMTEKVFELYEMLDHADDDEYPNHISEGSLRNSGTSLIRRMFLVANAAAILREYQLSSSPYPYVVVDKGFNEFISNLIMKFWKLPSGFRKCMVCMLTYALYKDYTVSRYIQFNRPIPFTMKPNSNVGLTGFELHGGIIHLIQNNPPGTISEYEKITSPTPVLVTSSKIPANEFFSDSSDSPDLSDTHATPKKTRKERRTKHGEELEKLFQSLEQPSNQ